MKTSAATVDKTVYCITIIVLQQLIAPQLRKESTATNENYVKLNVILHQTSKLLNTIVCGLALRGTPNKKKLIVTKNRAAQAAVREHGPLPSTTTALHKGLKKNKCSIAWVEKNHRYTMQQKGPKLGKKKTPYCDGATGDALWNGDGSTDEETTEDGRDGNEDAAICPGITRKAKIRNEVVRNRMKVGSLQDKLKEWRLKWKSRISRTEGTCVGKVVQQVKVGNGRDEY